MASDSANGQLAAEAGLPSITSLPRSAGNARATHTATRCEDSMTFVDISKSYATPSGEVNALVNINLSIKRAEVFGFIGRSGAGKSTLIRLINLLEKPTRGNITVNGASTHNLAGEGLVQLRRGIGMIFQHFNLMSAKTVAHNVALPLIMAGVAKPHIDAKVSELLALVGLSEKRDAYPAQLSGGQKQRVGIARALVHDPQILLCDEATSALDPENTRSILELLREINRRNGITVVLITHEMAVIREVCDRVAVLDRGQIVESDDVWKVFGSPRHAITKSLLGQLDHAIPDDLVAHLKPGYPAGEGTLLIRATLHPGSASSPDLQAVLQVMSGPVKLLDSAVDRISGHTFGRLLVCAPSRDNTLAQIERRLSALPYTVDVEVLGHVTTHV